MRLRPYPEYRDSGVEWLGRIPAHWSCLALSRVTLSRCDGPFGSGLKSEHYTGAGVRVVRLQNIGEGAFRDGDHAYVSEDYARELGDHSVKSGDLLVAGLGDEGHPVGRACVAPVGIEPAMVKADCFRFRPDLQRVTPAFAAYQLSSTATPEGAFATGSTRARLNLGTMAKRKVALPPADEQPVIAAFLDRETARIDALVAKKERLLDLLQEKGSALITQAVTKGLDPNVAMKNPGIEWLGEIPAHWGVLTLRRLVRRIEQGWSPVAEDRLAGLDEWAVIKLSAVSQGRFLADEHKALPADLAPDRRYEIREGDFLLTRANTPELVGDVCVAHGVRNGLMLCDLVYRLRLAREQLTPAYLAYWLLSRAGRYQIEVDARGSSQSMVKVSQALIRAWAIVLPPAEEQRRIVAILDCETARSDALAVKIREAIDRLKELRGGLIAAAVTGKIDVREKGA